jgi:hypothetical protein
MASASLDTLEKESSEDSELESHHCDSILMREISWFLSG